MEVAELLIADHKKIAEAQAEIVKRNTQIEALAPWMSLEVAMNYPGTKKTAMLLGTMAAETTLEMIYGKLAEDHPEIEAVDISVISQDKDAVYLSVFCMKEQAADVENTLRTAGFSRPVVSTEQIPAKQKAELEEQIRQIEADNRKYPGRDHIPRRRPGGTEGHRRLLPDACRKVRSTGNTSAVQTYIYYQWLRSERSGTGDPERNRGSI